MSSRQPKLSAGSAGRGAREPSSIVVQMSCKIVPGRWIGRSERKLATRTETRTNTKQNTKRGLPATVIARCRRRVFREQNEAGAVKVVRRRLVSLKASRAADRQRGRVSERTLHYGLDLVAPVIRFFRWRSDRAADEKASSGRQVREIFCFRRPGLWVLTRPSTDSKRPALFFRTDTCPSITRSWCSWWTLATI